MPATAEDTGFPQEGPHWVLAPYFIPQGLGGAIALGFAQLEPLHEEANRAYLHAAIAFFSAYERLNETIAKYKSIIKQIADISGAKLYQIPVYDVQEGQVPWLDRVPLVQREAYLAALREALEEKKPFWQPPPEIALREIIVFVGDHLIRLGWS